MSVAKRYINVDWESLQVVDWAFTSREAKEHYCPYAIIPWSEYEQQQARIAELEAELSNLKRAVAIVHPLPTEDVEREAVLLDAFVDMGLEDAYDAGLDDIGDK